CLLGAGPSHLVGPPAPFEFVTAYVARARRSLGSAQDDNWPFRPEGGATRASLSLRGADVGDALVEGRRHRLVHRLGVGAFNEIRRPAHATEERLDLVSRHAGPEGGVVDLVTVQVQDRQDGAV